MKRFVWNIEITDINTIGPTHEGRSPKYEMPRSYQAVKTRIFSRFRRKKRYQRISDPDLDGDLDAKTPSQAKQPAHVGMAHGSLTRNWISGSTPHLGQEQKFYEERQQAEEISGTTGERLDEKPSRSVARRRSSTWETLKTYFGKKKQRRDAICEQMERNIESDEGVSLRQYRKLLVTTNFLCNMQMM